MTNLAIQNDPNIVLPPSVRATIAKADAYYVEDQNTENAQDTENVQDLNNADAPTEAPEATAAQPTQDDQPKPEPTQVTDGSEDDLSWERRYKAMKGRFDRSQDQIKAMSEQISSLQNLMATLQTVRPDAGSEFGEAPASTKLLTEDEERDYGQDFLKVVGKKAKEELSPEVSALKKQVADLEAKLTGVNGFVAQNAREKMLSDMDARLPNWREVNVNDEFKSWLALPDPYSGVIRHDMLKAAYAGNDTRRVLAFFNGFLAEEAAVAPARADSDQGTVVPKIPLQDLAAPGRAKTAAASGAPAEKPFFTRAQIAAFYADCATGKYRGKDAEKDRMEKSIFDAQQEGRIR